MNIRQVLILLILGFLTGSALNIGRQLNEIIALLEALKWPKSAIYSYFCCLLGHIWDCCCGL